MRITFVCQLTESEALAVIGQLNFLPTNYAMRPWSYKM